MFFKPTKVIREYSLVYFFAVINCYQCINRLLDLGGSSMVTNTSCGSRGGTQRVPAPTPLFLDQNEARRADKKNFESAPPLSQGLDEPSALSEGLDPPLNT